MGLVREAVTSRLNPVGALKGFPALSTKIPVGWLLCNGAAVSRTQYVDLFNLIGTAYGIGDGTTTFNLPDLTGNVPVGFQSGNPDFGTLGGVGGVSAVTLTTTQMPQHFHTGTTNTENQQHTHSGTTALGGGHSHPIHTIQPPGSLVDYGWQNVTGSSQVVINTDPVAAHQHTFTTGNPNVGHNHGFTTGNAGTSGSHTNLQPYVVMNFIVKY